MTPSASFLVLFSAHVLQRHFPVSQNSFSALVARPHVFVVSELQDSPALASAMHFPVQKVVVLKSFCDLQ
jgi:hypothetical protein